MALQLILAQGFETYQERQCNQQWWANLHHLWRLVLSVGFVVPDTALSWAKDVMSEVIDRHKSIRVAVLRHYTWIVDAATALFNLILPLTPPQVLQLYGSLYLLLSLMQCTRYFSYWLREREHPQRKKFLIDLSQAIFSLSMRKTVGS